VTITPVPSAFTVHRRRRMRGASLSWWLVLQVVALALFAVSSEESVLQHAQSDAARADLQTIVALPAIPPVVCSRRLRQRPVVEVLRRRQVALGF